MALWMNWFPKGNLRTHITALSDLSKDDGALSLFDVEVIVEIKGGWTWSCNPLCGQSLLWERSIEFLRVHDHPTRYCSKAFMCSGAAEKLKSTKHTSLARTAAVSNAW